MMATALGEKLDRMCGVSTRADAVFRKGGTDLDIFSDDRWEVPSRPYKMFGPLITPLDLALNATQAGLSDYSPAEISNLQALAEFMTGVLPRTHEELGRAGPVCPYSSGSLRRGMMRLTASRLRHLDDDLLSDAMRMLRHAFLSEKMNENTEEVFRSITVVFPHLPGKECAAMIDRVQQSLKPSFVRSGLMIGEFYPDCPAPGLHNTAFRPLQTPVVCLSIRHMTVFDAPFMIDDDQHLALFLARYGQGGENRVRSSVANRNCPQTFARVQAVVAAQGKPYEVRAPLS